MTGTALMVVPQPEPEFNIPLKSPYPSPSPFIVVPEEGFEQDPESDHTHLT